MIHFLIIRLGEQYVHLKDFQIYGRQKVYYREGKLNFY